MELTSQTQAGAGRRDVLFVCAPSLGILDQWLPVLSLLRERHGVCAHVLFPDQAAPAGVNPGELLHQLGDSLFASAVFRTVYGQWVQTTSMDEARQLARFTAVDRLAARINHRSPLPVGPVGGRFVQGLRDAFMAPSGIARNVVSLQELRQRTGAVLFDVHIAKNFYFRELAEVFGDLPWFSLRHGPNVFVGEGVSVDKDSLPQNITAYLHSGRETGPYEEHYGLPPERCKVVGIPRHEPWWVDHICSRVQSDLPEDFEKRKNGFVFLISRPAGMKHFPLERKQRAVEDIRQVVLDELGCGLVVKPHPKELHEGLYEAVLGQDRQGRDWVYSRNHPYWLGRHCRFATAFLTAVCADMIMVGAPIIERLDLRGFDQSVSPRIGFDAAGNPIMQYQRDGLVYNACDLQQLRQRAAWIEEDRERALAGLRQGYDALFAPPLGSIERIVGDVFAALEG